MARTETEGAPEHDSARRPWTRIDIVVLLLLVLVAGFLRFAGLGTPEREIFDEVYYAKDSCAYVMTMEECQLTEGRSEVHPPLGKWLIGTGIEMFGYDAFGWRAAGAFAGTLTVALLFVLGRRLLNSLIGAALAAGLLAIDFLHLVQSRISMLDIFVPLFAVAGFLFLVIDRDQLYARAEARIPLPTSFFGRPWRAAAGLMGGAATASKWSGGLVLLALVVLSCAWEVSIRRRTDIEKPFRSALLGAGPNIVMYLFILPMAVYMLSYVGRLDGEIFALPWNEGSWLNAFVNDQRNMFSFHQGLDDATHHYQSPAWSWLMLRRPVAYFYEDAGEGKVQEIMAFGSPFVWWASIIALIFVAVNWYRKRDMSQPEGVILAGFAFTYLPWLLPQFGRPAVFLFYLVPTVPFMCLALGYALTSIGWTWEAKAAQALFVAGALIALIYFQPLLRGSTIAREKWDARIWFDDSEKGCKRPEGTPSTTTVTEVTQGEEEEVVKETNDNSSLPPNGWCWI